MPDDRSRRRNLAALTAATFIGFAGFTLVMPFLPLYFQELGVTDLGEVALWSGISLGVTPAMTAVFSPLWGRLADRWGRKLMVQRSLISFICIMAATAWVTEPWHVFALRVVQGFFAGYGAMVLAMAAESAPPARMAQALGVVQTAMRLGPALGPVIGGVIAQLVGLRRAFLVSAGFYAVGFVLVMRWYREPRETARRARPSEKTGQVIRRIVSIPRVLALMAVIFLIQFVDRSYGPILPLFVADIGVPDHRVPLMAGIVFSAAAAGGAVGHNLSAWLLRRYPIGRVLVGGAIAGVAAALGLAAAGSMTIVIASSTVLGLSIGVASTAAYTAAGAVLPASARATGFATLTSASLAGTAISPMMSGALGAVSIRGVFLVAAVVFAIVAAMVSRMMLDRAETTESRFVEDA